MTDTVVMLVKEEALSTGIEFVQAELEAARQQVADLRAGIEALVEYAAAEVADAKAAAAFAAEVNGGVLLVSERARLDAWETVYRKVSALLAGSGEQPDGEGVSVEWGVGYGDQRIATDSREEAEEWIADDDAWATGEKRWLIMRQVGPWTRIAREEADDD